MNNLTEYKGEYLDKLIECIPILDNAIYDDDSRTRYDAFWHYRNTTLSECSAAE